MRKLKLQMQLSIDGYVAGVNGEMDWMIWDWDDNLKEYISGITQPVDCILLGRVLAQGFIPHWKAAAENPETSDDVARKFHETPKKVFSRTIRVHDWPNAELAAGELTNTISASIRLFWVKGCRYSTRWRGIST